MRLQATGKHILGVLVMSMAASAFAAHLPKLPTPPDVWRDYDPDAGDFKEEIVHEDTKDGIYTKDAYISAYVNGEEVRVFCKYAVKAGAKNAPGLMNVHGWMGEPAIDKAYVNDGWAVLAHDYSGITSRLNYTKYPEALAHGHMEGGKMGYSLIYNRMPDGSQLTDPKATSHYLWNAVQRRALSYLLAQKEVDPERIGAKGYSYGGTIMWNLATDPRVKAVVAYFGIGWINYYRDRGVWMYDVPHSEPEKTPGEELFLSAVAPQAHAPYITAASLWLNGSNDHHGGHERGCETFKMFEPGVPWDFAIQARGHHDTNKLGGDCKLWLEKHVLGRDVFWPARPVTELKLDADGVPEFHVTPASPGKVAEITAWYALKNPVSFGRAWRDAELVRHGDTWVAKLPVLNVDDYVFAFANIRYDNNCVVSSDFEAVIPCKLGNAVATDKKSNVISDGTGQWSDVGPVEGVGGIQGFRPLNNRFGTSNKQFSDPKWHAPEGALLNFQFYCTQPQALILEANGQFVTDLDITASDDWQSMTIEAGQLKHKAHGFALGKWSEISVLAIKPKPEADITKVVFANFKWIVPQLKPDALAAATACAASVAAGKAERPAKPNVLLLLTDDLGWQDVKCYDIDEPSPMETPNIDALAKKGVMFWQAYSPAPVCTPSRVAIMSGQHPTRTGVTSVSGGRPPHFWKPQEGSTSPWNGDYFPASTVSLAAALKEEGYVTGHSGKWHFYPGPLAIGFDSTCQDRGVQNGMPNRLTGFATHDPTDPYRLDENGFPYDVPQHAVLDFLQEQADPSTGSGQAKPFFLYYATWLVHGPISMKSEQLLQKYVKKLGVELKPEHKDVWPMEGQTNPFYAAMVEELDYYVGQVFTYLETTDDPRWPGHKLFENTYIIFTSDNGGMENRPGIDRFTENAPLDKGKISTKEGGTRVPLIITGPGIPAGVQTDVMANGLDFYPTILSLIGADKSKDVVFDGCDLKPLLMGDPTDPTLVRDAQGKVRDTMFWHFPQMEGTTSIRVGAFKLRRSSMHGLQPLELYRLYRTENGKQVRVDIEEAHNLAEEMPEKAKELEARRAELVAAMGGRYGHRNPDWPGELPGKEKAPRILSHKQTGRDLIVSYENRGVKVVHADLIYTLNGGSKDEQWHRADMTLEGDGSAVAEAMADEKAVVTLPEGTTHYFINLVDKNGFLVVYPKIDASKLHDQGLPFSAAAIFAGDPKL